MTVTLEPRPAGHASSWSREELIAEVEHLRGSDSPWSIAERLGMSIDSVARRLGRAGRHDLARPFYRAQREARST